MISDKVLRVVMCLLFGFKYIITSHKVLRVVKMRMNMRILTYFKYAIYMLSYLYVSYVTRINLDKHVYIHIEWKGKM